MIFNERTGLRISVLRAQTSKFHCGLYKAQPLSLEQSPLVDLGGIACPFWHLARPCHFRFLTPI